MKKFKKGDKVKLKKSELKFYKEEAFNMNSVKRVLDEIHAESYFAYMLIGRGYSYKATIISDRHFTSNNYQVEFKFDCGLTIMNYQDPENIVKAK